MKLSHQDLVRLGENLGYASVAGGLCRGFSCMWMQAVLSGKEAKFYERLNLIYRYKNHFGCSPFKRLVDLIEEAKNVARRGEVLTEEQKNLIEVLAFYEGISLFLFPYSHRDLFNGELISPNNIQAIYQVTKYTLLKDKDISIFFEKSYAFDRNTLPEYLDDLAEILRSTSAPLVLILGSDSHSVCLKYNITRLLWHYIDTEEFIKTQFINSSYYREINTQALSTSLFTSFRDNESVHTLFHTTVSGVDLDEQARNRFRQLDLRYKVKSKHACMFNTRQTWLLHLACKYNNFELVAQLLKYKHKICLVSPLYIACQDGYLSIVKELLKYTPDINQVHTNGFTPLYIAIFNGDIEIVKEFLNYDPDINQESKNRIKPLDIACLKGNLPIVRLLLEHNPRKLEALYFACYSPHTREMPELFKLLLDKGASITIKNEKGQTALDVALKVQHDAAIKVFLGFAIQRNQSLQEVMTPDSLRKAQCFIEENMMQDLFSYFLLEDNNKSRELACKKNLALGFFNSELLLCNERLTSDERDQSCEKRHGTDENESFGI